MLLHFGTRAYLFSPEEGLCYVFSTWNKCCEFFANDGVIIQSVIQSMCIYIYRYVFVDVDSCYAETKYLGQKIDRYLKCLSYFELLFLSKTVYIIHSSWFCTDISFLKVIYRHLLSTLNLKWMHLITSFNNFETLFLV